MILSELIRKGGLGCTMTATSATTATQVVKQSLTVAPVASVAVALPPETIPELSNDEALSIRAWFEHIGETNQTIIDEIMEKCRDEIAVRQYLLRRSEEIPEPDYFMQPLTCGSCGYFERIEHTHLGHCTKGRPEAIAGLRDDAKRWCDYHSPSTTT